MTTVQIDIPDRPAVALKSYVQTRGRTVEQWLVQIVEQAAPISESSPLTGQDPANNPERPIWDLIAERMKMLPPEVFERLPEDAASQHDHYIYGLPKRDE
jgi:hypothetical protein